MKQVERPGNLLSRLIGHGEVPGVLENRGGGQADRQLARGWRCGQGRERERARQEEEFEKERGKKGSGKEGGIKWSGKFDGAVLAVRERRQRGPA